MRSLDAEGTIMSLTKKLNVFDLKLECRDVYNKAELKLSGIDFYILDFINGGAYLYFKDGFLAAAEDNLCDLVNKINETIEELGRGVYEYIEIINKRQSKNYNRAV